MSQLETDPRDTPFPPGGTRFIAQNLPPDRTRGDVASPEGITLFLVDADALGLKRVLAPLTDDGHAADLLPGTVGHRRFRQDCGRAVPIGKSGYFVERRASSSTAAWA